MTTQRQMSAGKLWVFARLYCDAYLMCNWSHSCADVLLVFAEFTRIEVELFSGDAAGTRLSHALL